MQATLPAGTTAFEILFRRRKKTQEKNMKHIEPLQTARKREYLSFL